MHHLLKIAALSALLSAGCTLSRSAVTSKAGIATIPEPTRQIAARNLPRHPAEEDSDNNVAVADYHETADETRGTKKITPVDFEDQPQPLEEADQPPHTERPAPDPGIDLSVDRSGVYSLVELTALTEQEHPQLRKAMAEVEAVMGERVQAGLYPNPRMETNNPEIWAGRNSQLNFGWQQNFITKGKMRLDKAAADQKIRVEESQYVVERMRVLTEVRMQFVRALAARERLRNSEEILAISKSARDVSVELLNTGERTLTDVLLLKNQYERARVTTENNRTELDAELRQLAIATGIPNLVVNDVTGSIDERPPYYDEAYIREFLESNSAHMVMARAEVVRRKILLNRAEVEPYPDFRLGPHYAASTGAGSDREFWFTFVFDIPVWNLNQGNIRAARAEVAGAQAAVDQRRMELLNDLSDIHARHKTSQLLLARIESSILPNAEHTQQLVQEGYSQGQLDVNRLLEAQRALLEAKQDQIDAYEQAWHTAARLAGYLQFEQFP